VFKENVTLQEENIKAV